MLIHFNITTMYKYIFAIVFIFCSFSFANAQTIEEGIVEYRCTVDLDSINKVDPRIKNILYVTVKEKLFFKKDSVCTQEYADNDVLRTDVFDFQDSIVSINHTKKYVKKSPNISISQYESSVEYVEGETQEIAGFLCYKAYYRVKNEITKYDVTYLIYYTPKIVAVHRYFKGFDKGLILAYETLNAGVKKAYRAVKVQTIPIPATTFAIPKNYEYIQKAPVDFEKGMEEIKKRMEERQKAREEKYKKNKKD